jgi:cation:H+ antiporter
MLLTTFIIFIVSLIVLIKASDFFVESAKNIAELLNISTYIIGFTLVAIGTSLPELVSSVAASYYGSTGLIIGNIIGSNIANIGLILGITSFIGTIASIKKRVFYHEGLTLLAISILFMIFSLDNHISRLEGLFFLLGFIGYSFYIIKFNIFKRLYASIPLMKDFIKYKIFRKKKKEELKEEIKEEISKEKKPVLAILKELSKIVLSGEFMKLSVDFLIPSAQNLSLGLGISETIVGITMLAVGTSLPELVVSISSIRKGLGDLLIGTIIGSNISNILLVGGSSAIIRPLTIGTISKYYYIPFSILLTIVLLALIKSRWELRKIEGSILFSLYIIFIISLLFLG